MTIFFKSVNETMRFMNPFKDFEPDEIPIEIRYDPLTGQTSRIFDLAYRPIERPDFTEMIKKSRETMCPFCPEAIEKSTTLYPREIIPEGKVRVGEACIFPNLLPLDRYTGVCVMSREHYIAIEELGPEKMRDAFMAVLSFLRQIAEQDPAVLFFNANWNYMPPAGSSIVHPHLQINCGEIPTRQLSLQMEASRSYYMEKGRTFWEDYIAAERDAGERFLMDLGPTSWTMSFAPHSAYPDLWFIFPGHSSILELEDEELDPFLLGLTGAIKYISGEGFYSFNVSIFSGREDGHFRLNGRISPRFLLREIGNSDQTYYQVLHREPCSMKPPESMREKVYDLFRDIISKEKQS